MLNSKEKKIGPQLGIMIVKYIYTLNETKFTIGKAHEKGNCIFNSRGRFRFMSIFMIIDKNFTCREKKHCVFNLYKTFNTSLYIHLQFLRTSLSIHS